MLGRENAVKFYRTSAVEYLLSVRENLMKQIHKEYGHPFLLEPTKLTRLIDKIHGRLAEHEPTMNRDSFEVFLSGNRREEMGSVDEVLALENSRTQKIQRLLISCSAGRKVAARLDDEVQVDFGGKKTGTTSDTEVIAIGIRSDAAGWASSTLSELEEQVERTRLHYIQPILTLVGLLIAALLVLASQFIAIQPRAEDVVRGMWLHDSDLERVDQILSQDRTITEEEMREIATRQLRNIREDQRPKQLPQKGRTRQIVSLAIPLVTILACGLILLLTCYPRAVFLWGDEVERHSKTLYRRKALWTIIIGVMLIGLLSNILIVGVVPWLPPE